MNVARRAIVEQSGSAAQPSIGGCRPNTVKPMMTVVALPAAALILGACGHDGAANGSTGTVVGHVRAGPTCPVEQVGVPCPPRPVVGAEVRAMQGSHEAATTRSGAAGLFTLALPAGRYMLVATNVGGYESTASTTVDVPASGDVVVTLELDTGIR
jgi:carboxypeptidase family protein